MIGIGMGGFIDGIVFHQILQVHNMLSARIPTTTLVGAKVNMVWDGAFHLGVWVATAIGIKLLWDAARRDSLQIAGQAFVGTLLLGWGLFNVVEGLIDHHLLHLHHVVEAMGESAWDYAFLGWGAVMIVIGLALMRSHGVTRVTQ